MSVTIGGSIDSVGESIFADPVLSPDGLTLASHAGDTIILWNGITGTQLQEIYKIAEDNTRALIDLSGMAFSPDGHWLATGGDSIRLWDMTFNSVTVLQAELDTTEGVSHVAFSLDGDYLLGSSQTNTELWDANNRERVAILTGAYGLFGGGDLVITHSADRVFIWDREGEPVAELHSASSD